MSTVSQIPNRGFYVLNDNPKWLGQKEVLFWSGNVFGPNMYCQKSLNTATGAMNPFTSWEKASLNQIDFDIMKSDFDYYEKWEDVPKTVGLPFLDVAPPYVKQKGNKLHRSEYFKMYIIQDFLKENGYDYTQLSDDAILIMIKRYKGWVQKGFPKSLKDILRQIIIDNPKVTYV